MKAQIQFSAGSLSLNDVPATNALIEGSIDNDRVTLTNLRADIARGTLTGNAQRNADGSWQVEKPAHGGYPSAKRKIANRLLCAITLCPVRCRLVAWKSSTLVLQGPDWAVTDLDLSLRNTTFSKDDWQTQEGNRSMNRQRVYLWLAAFI